MKDKRRTKEEIRSSLTEMRERNLLLSSALRAEGRVTDYAALTFVDENGYTVWTEAFQKAIDENEIIRIDEGTYYVDKTLVIPSNRKIIAYGAHVKKVPEMNTMLLRNEHLRDGSYFKIDGSDEDENITILGGTWEDTGTVRTFHHGLYDAENSMVGVSACMCFINIRGLYLSEIKIIRAGLFRK